MSLRLSSTALFVIMGLSFSPMSLNAQETDTSSYKVLANEKTGLNLATIKELIQKGDESFSEEELDQARKYFDEARVLTRQLLSFYRDINGSFRGIDARIPREMDSKGREAQVLLAKTNLRLASLFRRRNEPEVAVPLLIEVLKLMTPTRAEGQKAYQTLLELGFVETPYAGARKEI